MNLHIVYIPIVLLLGLAIGYALGLRAGKREATRQYEQAQR